MSSPDKKLASDKSDSSSVVSSTDVVALYERAEALVDEERLLEAAQFYDAAFEIVKKGNSVDDKSRAPLLATKLANVHLKLGDERKASEYFDFLGQPMPVRHFSSTHNQWVYGSRPASRPDLEGLKPLFGVKIDELLQAAMQTDKFTTGAEVASDDDKRMTFTISWRISYGGDRTDEWSYVAIGVAERFAPGGVISSGRRPYQHRRQDGLIQESTSNATLGELFALIRSRCPSANLLIDTILVKSSKSPQSNKALKRFAMEAWCEAFEVPVPSENELKERGALAKAAQAKELEQALRELRGGITGVAIWNDRPEDRKTAVKLRAADLCSLDMSGVRFYKNDLTRTQFTDAEVNNALIDQCELSGASFVRAKMDDARFSSCKAGKANFAEASLVNAAFNQTALYQANFQNANLQNAEFRNDRDYVHRMPTRANFENADLTQARFIDTDVCGCNFLGANFTDVKFENTRYDHDTKFPIGFESGHQLRWVGLGPDPVWLKKLKMASPTVPLDFNMFLKALEARCDAERLKKALKMLKTEKFQLFSEVTASSVTGVVKSQTNPDLIYSCRLASSGQFSCCTQNLKACGGLYGKLCKHLLVLIIGLVHNKELDANKAEDWATTSKACRAVLDNEMMGDIFMRYQAAQTGEIDWRPTETMPEDYYAF